MFSVTALAMIRGAQGRDDEAEDLFLSAIDMAKKSDLRLNELHPLEHFVSFLRLRSRDEDAAVYEARLLELTPEPDARTERIA